MVGKVKLSVITPCFNSRRWIGSCVASVRDQISDEALKRSAELVENVETLRSLNDLNGFDGFNATVPVAVHHHIQDGGSTDGTRGFLEKLAAVDGSSLVVDGGSETLDNEHSATYQLTFASEADKGMYNALNKAFAATAPSDTTQLATSDVPHPTSYNSIVGHLNADEQYLPGTLRFVADFFEKHPKVDVLFGAVVVTDAEGNYICSRMPLKPQLWHTQVCHLATFTASMFFRRSAIEKLDCYFDESFQTAGDADLICRMLKAKLKMATVRRYFSVFVDSGDNLAETSQGRLEMRRMATYAPRIVQRLHNLIEGWQKGRKLFGGIYFMKPFTYQFFDKDLSLKQHNVRAPSGVWRNRRPANRVS